MKKILFGLMFLLLVSCVYAADTATLTGITLSGSPGQSNSGAITLTNTGNTTLSGSVTAAFTSGSVTAAISPTSFSGLAPNATQTFTVTINIPTGHALGTYTAAITANFVGVAAGTATSTLTANVNSAVSGPSFTIDALEAGSSTQERGATTTPTLHITNNGNQALTISLSSTLPSAYALSFSQAVVSLNVGASIDVPVTITVPLSQDSGRNILTGGITGTATNVAGVSRTASVYMAAQSELELYKVAIELNNDGTKHSMHSGDTYSTDVKAGVPITFTAYVRNNFDSSDKIEIQDVTVDVRSSGDLDLDDSEDLNDLDYGDKDEISFSTSIPSDAEDGDNYDVDFTVTGRDENGAEHTDTFSGQIEVKRESHEITIKSFSISPQTISCRGLATISATLENTGRSNEDNVQLEIRNDVLNLDQRLYNMKIDVDDTLKKTYSFNIANDTAPGAYDIILTSFYENTDSDVQVITLNVNPCQATQTTPPAGNNNPQLPPGYTPVTPASGATPVYGSTAFNDSTAYIILLAAGVIIILAIVIILLVKFVF